ncbi:MAG: hypothetical protein QM638_00705 [Nocardioides sp.]|uniref:hypothetical protein n=1 Tax=Nocardioides sp. TaxID=35761 RepID=UPI0039E36028
MDMLERLERTRDGARFDELLDELLPGDESARATAVELLARLPSGSYRHIGLVAKCGECGVWEAIPQIREAFENPGKRPRDTQASAVWALNDLLGPEERIKFLIEALDQRDFTVAELAASFIGGSEDSGVVEPLLAWLHDRLQRARSQTQAHCTTEVIAACVRLADSAQSTRLHTILDGARLTKLEQLAADGLFPGLELSGRAPIMDWPD